MKILTNLYNLKSLSEHDNDHHHYEFCFKIWCHIEMMCLKNGCFKKHIVYINSTTNIVRNIQDKNITIQNINKKVFIIHVHVTFIPNWLKNQNKQQTRIKNLSIT